MYNADHEQSQSKLEAEMASVIIFSKHLGKNQYLHYTLFQRIEKEEDVSTHFMCTSDTKAWHRHYSEGTLQTTLMNKDAEIQNTIINRQNLMAHRKNNHHAKWGISEGFKVDWTLKKINNTIQHTSRIKQ